MKTQRTYYHLIVDRSGSMSDCTEAAINGYNEQICRIKDLQNEFPEQDIRVGLTLFNEHINLIHAGNHISEIPMMNRLNYVPSGGTALLDAIGETVVKISEKNDSSDSLPSTYVVVVLTDGYENSSKKFTLEEIRSMVKARESTGKWTFSFIGATLDAVDVAKSMAFQGHNSIHFDKAKMDKQVWANLSNSMREYLNRKKSGGDISHLFDKE